MEQAEQNRIEAFIERHYAEIFRYCLWHCASRQEAEDATQDTFLKAIRHAVHEKREARAYLYRIAATTCIDVNRTRGAVNTSLDAVEPAYLEPAFERFEGEETFLSTIAALPDQQREPILLHYGHRLRLTEIAHILGLPLRTVQSRIRAGLKQLKRNMTGGD